MNIDDISYDQLEDLHRSGGFAPLCDALNTIANRINPLKRVWGEWYDIDTYECICNICGVYYYTVDYGAIRHGLKHLQERGLLPFI